MSVCVIKRHAMFFILTMFEKGVPCILAVILFCIPYKIKEIVYECIKKRFFEVDRRNACS